MKIDIDELSPVQRKVRVELPAEAVASEFAHAYKNLGNRVRVKGFRTGKIPRSVLQGIYGEEVKGEVKSHLVEESLGEVIKERGLQIVSRPEVEANDLSEGSDFSFSAVFEIKPEIQVKDYLGVEVEKVKISVADDQVQDALKRIQEGHARLELVEGRDIVQTGDFVTLDFEGTIAGKPFSGGKGENYTIEVGSGQALPKFEEAVVGLKFAKDHGEHGSLDELKAAIRQRLEGELKHYQDEDLKEKIMSRLIENHALTIPPSMVERQTRYLMERYQSQIQQAGAEADAAPPMEDARKNLEGRAARQVQATLLVEKISQQENIEINEQDIQERVDNLARSAGDRAKSVREYYARPEARDDLRAQIVFDRTLGYLLERAQIKEVDPPASKVDEPGEKS
jgi:trigger factor